MTNRAHWIVIAIAGCAGAKTTPETASASASPGKPATPAAAPMRVELGGCAGADVTFVSGVDERAVAAPRGGTVASITGFGDMSSGFDDANGYGGLLGDEVGELTGGSARGSGSARPGGGGTGWGTIGTGRYGTIGHGSGIGYGRGGSRGKIKVPTVSTGAPSASTTGLDKAIIRRYIRRNVAKITLCYENQLLRKPKLSGTVVATFTIEKTGLVTKSTASGLDADVASCVANVIGAIEFSKPQGGGVVEVKYPFTFRPSEDAPASKPDAAAPKAVTPATTATPAPPATPVASAAASPLRDQRDALAACLRREARPYGVFVVDLDFDQRGAVTTAIVRGIASDDARACISGVAGKIVQPHAPAVQRCAVAFGAMPIDALPALDIAVDAFRWQRAAITDQALRDALARQRSAPLAAQAAVDVRGPIVVRPLAATPIERVITAIAIARDTGVGHELAAERAGGWRLLREVELPAAPIATGAGLVVDPADAPADSGPSIAIGPGSTVLTAGAWSREVTDPTTLAAALGELKQHAGNTGALRIAAAGVAYGEVVRWIDAAKLAGFPAWRLSAP